MKKSLLSLLLMSILINPAHSQSLKLGLEARGGYMFDSTPHFFADFLTVSASGSIDDRFSYVWKQRLTKPVTGSQPLNGTDVLSLSYSTGPWTFTLGKQVLECGGLEYDAPPIDLHFTSESYMNINCYVLAATATRQVGLCNIKAQVSRSPFATFDNKRSNSLLAFSLALHSEYGRFWVPHYSLNLFEVSPRTFAFQQTLGNRFELTRWLTLEYDLINRCKPGEVNLLKDFTMIGYSSIRPFDWLEIMFKAIYDKNNLWNDPLLPKGFSQVKVGTGAYFFPTADRRSVRFHYYLYSWSGNTVFEVGLTIKPTILNIDFRR